MTNNELNEINCEIRPHQGWSLLNLQELWRYRELFYFLAWRDVKIRYKQTIFGVLWAILQPLISITVFTLIFQRFISHDVALNVSYPLFVLAGWLPWMFFNNSINSSSNCLVGDANLIKKVYFPRLIMPIANISASLIELAIMLIFFFLMYLWQGYHLSVSVLLLPLTVLYLFAVTCSFGVWLAAINALYRDVRYAVPFLLQTWFFVTPVIYPLGFVSGKWQVIYTLNPLVGVVESFRWSLLGCNYQSLFMPFQWSLSIAMTLVLLISGVIYFRHVESTVADLI